jgi:hypothetical protein
MQVKSYFDYLIIDGKLTRQILNSFTVLGLVLVIGLLTSADAGACASCGCTLSPDWENQQFSYTPGIKMDLRWDYLNQDQLRSGTGTISSSDAAKILNSGAPQEVEKYTRNNYYTLGIDYSKTPDFGVNVQVPYIDRSHSTLGRASNDYTPGPGGGQYDSHTSSLGDIKITGRYQGFIPGCNALGVIFGVKLPTGSHNQTGGRTLGTLVLRVHCASVKHRNLRCHATPA